MTPDTTPTERALREDGPRCAYQCPYSEARHSNWNAGHDFVFPSERAARAEPGLPATDSEV